MPPVRLVRGYLLLVGLPLLALIAVVSLGKWLKDPAAAQQSFPVLPLPATATPPALMLILQIIVILVAARAGGALFRRVGQPQVMGEMAAGIVLGPSVLGWLAPSASSTLFPAASLGHLNVLSQLGLVLFMFLVGLSLNPNELKAHGHAAVLTSHVSIAVPFAFGAGLALYLYPGLAGAGVGFTAFALFMGAAMSITAFPVLARILTERNMLRSRMGTLAIACAAVDDVTGWCILAYITLLIRSPGSAVPVWLTVLGSLVFVAVMLLIARPFVRCYAVRLERDGYLRDGAIVSIMLLVLSSAVTTDLLGIHLLFGGFLAGAIMPKSREFVRYMHERFESITLLLFMPLFFAFTGLRTSVALVQGSWMWMVLALIIAVAVAGKMGGSTIAAHAAGLSWRESAATGALLNTRGLMELVILNIGLDVHVITPALFTMMVLMALATTLMTAPLLNRIYPQSVVEASHAREEQVPVPPWQAGRRR